MSRFLRTINIQRGEICAHTHSHFYLSSVRILAFDERFHCVFDGGSGGDDDLATGQQSDVKRDGKRWDGENGLKRIQNTHTHTLTDAFVICIVKAENSCTSSESAINKCTRKMKRIENFWTHFVILHIAHTKCPAHP